MCDLLTVWCLLALLTELAPAALAASRLEHGSNWAVLINVSRYWFNYRHASNVFSLYHTVKKLGIPDERVIVMNADDFACNTRNSYPGQIYNERAKATNLYSDHIETDYRNYDVTLDNVLRVLTDRHPPSTARSKRLLSDHNSNVMIYITGHGGNEFMKIQDHEEISAMDLANAIAEMHERGRYKRMFLIAETCQASTMFNRIRSPNVFTVAASKKNENSYSYQLDPDIGLTVVDRFTYYTQRFFEGVDVGSKATMWDWYKMLTYDRLRSTLVHSEGRLGLRPQQIPLNDFFGHVANTTPSSAEAVPLERSDGDAVASSSHGIASPLYLAGQKADLHPSASVPSPRWQAYL